MPASQSAALPIEEPPAAPFTNPDWTAKGEPRAHVALMALRTLWFNTGTLCNITCANCYIDSSPSNDRLVYLGVDDIRPFLDEIVDQGLATAEIGFTGGEPFLNPAMAEMAALCLSRGFSVLILTNAMQPMMRPKVKAALLNLKARYGDQLTLRVSIDHHSPDIHDEERGEGGFARMLEGLSWLSENGFAIALAGRTRWGDEEADLRAGYAEMLRAHGVDLDADDPHKLVLFPEMDETAPAPEITTACWGILDVSPDAMMCASSRMVVKRKGAARAVVLPCTLLPYEPAFEMGETLAESAAADGGAFSNGSVKLNHRHCAKFCVLGGGSCSQ